MYTLAVPVFNWYNNRTMDPQAVLSQLRRCGANRVWLCSARGIESESRLQEELRLLKEHRIFFQNNGLEVGVWISSLGHGGVLMQDDKDALSRASQYEKQVGMNGETCPDTFCPTGEAFAQDYSHWIARIAATGADMIMLDDDYRLSVRSNGFGCCCPRHMADYQRRVGENIKREQLHDLVMRGGKSKYRDAWLDMGRDGLLSLARRIRQEVDKVNPSTRVGFCTVLSSWDVDGVDAVELTRAMAGNTRPFLRTSGAPYWCSATSLADRLSSVVEVTRLQRQWSANSDVELFVEGDPYPRPRSVVPASYLEMFDQILRADGEFSGILKYMLDYTSSTRYETGYVDAMVRNAPTYQWIEENMSCGKAEGADVFCPQYKLRNADIPDDMTDAEIEKRFFLSSAQALMCDNSIPTGYGIDSVHVVCDESAKYIDPALLNDGAVLDIGAARILMERGVDVGIRNMSGSFTHTGTEYYPSDNEYVATNGARRFRRLTLDEKALPLSQIDGEISCYRYENQQGQRFVVFAFDMWPGLHSWGLTRSYCRQRQLIEAMEWAGRKPLPAVCMGHPDLYIMCKRTEKGLAVGLWNLSVDFIVDPMIRVDRAYAALSCFRCEGDMAGNEIRLSGEIAPFSFAGILLTD